MKIVIAPDSFKESLTALEAASAIEEGFKLVFPDSDYIKVPMADGGEGTVQSIIDATGGTMKELTVTGPLQEPVDAFYGLSGDKKIAVIEMAASSGLDKVNPEKRNPLLTTTYGFGELIKDALDEGVEEILLGIGGSATNDGGAGMIMSLGGKLLDKNKKPISPNGKGLKDLAYIDITEMHSRINDVNIRVACDVDNPLTGEQGASYIYGPQKGGTPDQLKQLDANLSHFAQLIKETLGKDIEHIPGAGAAGGLGAGIMAFLNGKLERGGDLLVDLLDLEAKIKEADLVITGEGGINHQTIFGKTPIAVSQVSKKYGVPTIAFAGCLNKGYENIYDEGIDAAFSIIPEFSSQEDALANGYENLKNTAMNSARVLKIGLK
ncbi:glycerate kinase [Alkalibacterium sp. 20]|uniref:glycerate kinase n=1 Tax=Alkalibacterium sp. 20 TaxID=1798803 RepID=UPI0009004A9B|nr:glycerate kinase [Alkalibacterium sp. 20]OJF94684.1 glycerate kinase [Alkalibacterium sp. 20]